MKNTLLLSVIVLLSFSFFASCTKEEIKPEIDIRDQAVGTYDGDVFIFPENDITSVDTTWKQEFKVEKNKDNDLSINFIIDGEIAFKGAKIAEASNGFSFDLEEQTITDDGETYTIRGYDLVELAGTKYNGAYETSTKEIGAAYEIMIGDIKYVFLFGGKKK